MWGRIQTIDKSKAAHDEDPWKHRQIPAPGQAGEVSRLKKRKPPVSRTDLVACRTFCYRPFYFLLLTPIFIWFLLTRIPVWQIVPHWCLCHRILINLLLLLFCWIINIMLLHRLYPNIQPLQLVGFASVSGAFNVIRQIQEVWFVSNKYKQIMVWLFIIGVIVKNQRNYIQKQQLRLTVRQ